MITDGTITSLAGLDDVLTPDTVRRSIGAKVAFADYALLQADFAELSDRALAARFPELARLDGEALRRAVEERIDRWLLEHAAMVSEAQTSQTDVNSPILVGGQPLPAHRPPRYGRSVVVSLDEVRTERSAFRDCEGGLLDLKGVGVAADKQPKNTPYANGLEYLGVALGDYLVKRVIDAIFARTVPTLATVPVYAVLDLGFDVRDGWSGTAPAGVHVRKAHRRPRGGESIPETGSAEERMSVFIELLLRAFGVTTVNHGNCLLIESAAGGGLRVSSNERDITGALDDEDVSLLRRLRADRGDLRIERINVQFTREVDAERKVATIYDFGHVNIRAEFHNPLASTVADGWLCVGGVLWPDSPSFVMPKPGLAAPLETWHRHALNAFCFELARRFRAGEVDSARLSRTLEERLERLVSSWPCARVA